MVIVTFVCAEIVIMFHCIFNSTVICFHSIISELSDNRFYIRRMGMHHILKWSHCVISCKVKENSRHLRSYKHILWNGTQICVCLMNACVCVCVCESERWMHIHVRQTKMNMYIGICFFKDNPNFSQIFLNFTQNIQCPSVCVNNRLLYFW